jgi:hypothetical protein
MEEKFNFQIANAKILIDASEQYNLLEKHFFKKAISLIHTKMMADKDQDITRDGTPEGIRAHEISEAAKDEMWATILQCLNTKS